MLHDRLFTLRGASSSGFIAEVTGASSAYGSRMTLDDSGNIYVVGTAANQTGGSNDILIVKFNSSGVLQWQRAIGGSEYDIGTGIAVDSSGNVYVSGQSSGYYASGKGIGGSDFFLTKYDSNGNSLWLRCYGTDGPNGGEPYIKIDSSNNIYMVGTWTYPTNGSVAIALLKINSSGTIVWQRNIVNTSVTPQLDTNSRNIILDSSGNIYIIGDTEITNNVYGLLLAKYNSSGTIQWQRTLGSGDFPGTGVAVLDSSSNVCITGTVQSQGQGSGDFLIAKYNSSGTLQWQRSLGGTNTESSTRVATDSSNNIYIAGRSTSTETGDTANGNICIAKYNSSGTLQWQRYFGTSFYDSVDDITTDSTGNFYILTQYLSNNGVTNTYKFAVSKLPGDGSGTGTYGIYTYATSTLTDAARTLTSSTSSLTDQALSFSSLGITLTNTVTTLTSTVTNL